MHDYGTSYKGHLENISLLSHTDFDISLDGILKIIFIKISHQKNLNLSIGETIKLTQMDIKSIKLLNFV